MNVPKRIAVLLIFGGLMSLAATSTTSANASEECAITQSEKGVSINGPATVIDADTLWVGVFKVRLYGIEALEEDQKCTRNGKALNCAEESIAWLKQLIEGKPITCKIDLGKRGEPIMSYNRYLATCFLKDKRELNRMIVRSGRAIADRSPKGDIYRSEEAKAKQEGIGIHVGNFMDPKAFRKAQNTPKKPCPMGYQCVRSDRADLLELLEADK